MTIPNETAYVALGWTGAENSYAPGIRAASVNDMKLSYLDSSGNITELLNNTHLLLARNSTTGEITATVLTLPTPPGMVIFERETPAIQTTDFQNLTGYGPSVHTALHDAAAMRDAELRRRVLVLEQALPATPGTTAEVRELNFYLMNNSYLLADRLITTGQYTGIPRWGENSGIKTFFPMRGMTFCRDASGTPRGGYTAAQIQTACEVTLQKLVVWPWTASTAVSLNQKMCLNGKMFECTVAGTTGATAPSTTAAVLEGDLVQDNTAWWTLKLKKVLPTTWQYFIIDVKTNLDWLDYPDSHDAFAAMLLGAVRSAGVNSAWLGTASGVPGFTRLQLMRKLADENIIAGLNPGGGEFLSLTFQDSVDQDGNAYTIRWLDDNCMNFQGLNDLAWAYNVVGDTTNRDDMYGKAAYVKSGLVNLYDSTVKLFKYYKGQTDHANETWEPKKVSTGGFAARGRFQVSPTMVDMQTTLAEAETYGGIPLRTLMGYTPGMFTDSLDTYGLAGFYWTLFRKYGLPHAKTRLCQRVTERAASALTTDDLMFYRDVVAND